MKSSWKFLGEDELLTLRETAVSYPESKSVSSRLLESIAGIYQVSHEGQVKHPEGKVVTISTGTKICVNVDEAPLVYEAIELSILMEGSVVDLKPGAALTLIAT